MVTNQAAVDFESIELLWLRLVRQASTYEDLSHDYDLIYESRVWKSWYGLTWDRETRRFFSLGSLSW